MKCPACGAEMVEKDFGGVMIDVCDNGCKGIWFDWMELVKLDEKNEGMGAALQAALKHPRANDENRPPLNCPKCGIKMREHKHKRADAVNVDECFSCGGFFLDSGELREVRENFMTDEEHQEYVNSLVGNVSDFAVEKENQEMKKDRAEALLKATRYIRISYFMTGK